MESLFVTVGSLKLRYLESSAKKKNTEPWLKDQARGRHLLFIHGRGSQSERWLDIPDALSLSGFHSVALDLPGFGGSDKPSYENYTVEYFVQVVSEFMRKTGLDDGKTTIIGHSLGGYIAAQVAVEAAKSTSAVPIDRLVLIDSSGMLRGPTPLLKEYAAAAANPSKESIRKVFEKLVAKPERIPEVLVDGFIFRIMQPGAQAAFRSAYNNSVDTQIGIEKLRLFENPTLIIWGSKDMLIPIEYYHVFREAMKNAFSYIVQDAGHAPFAEKPAVACTLLRSFLES